MDATIHATEKVAEVIPAVGKALPPLRSWRDFMRGHDIERRDLLEPCEEVSGARHVVHLWATRDIQIGELFFCSLFMPLINVWLILPMPTFANNAFRLMRWMPEEVWGLIGLCVSYVWLTGITGQHKASRRFGAAATFFYLMTVCLSVMVADVTVLAGPITFALAVFVALLFWRQGWEKGAGEC